MAWCLRWCLDTVGSAPLVGVGRASPPFWGAAPLTSRSACGRGAAAVARGGPPSFVVATATVVTRSAGGGPRL